MKAKSNICATGVEYNKLGVVNEDEFYNKGLYYGAGASEAFFCKGKNVFVIGGGNSAGQAASYFSGFANHVFMVIRRDNLVETLSIYLLERIITIKNITILYNSEVKELQGENSLNRIRIFDNIKNKSEWFATTKLFVCIGGKPNTEWAQKTDIIRDIKGYLITGNDLQDNNDFKKIWKLERKPQFLETSVPGSFAIGDVRFNSIKRVASAVGEGAMAVSMVHNYLSGSS